MEFREFFHTMSKSERAIFAKKCGVSIRHLMGIARNEKNCSAELAISIEDTSTGKVRVESVCKNVNWNVIRNTQ